MPNFFPDGLRARPAGCCGDNVVLPAMITSAVGPRRGCPMSLAPLRWLPRLRSPRRKTRRPARARLTVEALESRLAPAGSGLASFDPAAGALAIRGGPAGSSVQVA